MAVVVAEPQLHVEGPDDKHVVEQLLTMHGVAYHPTPPAAGLPKILVASSIEQLLRAMRLAIETSSGRTMGFVLDADAPIQDRWAAVCHRLNQVDVAAPASPPSDGFIGWSNTYKVQVGIWLMPDNLHDGKLEDFLRTLVADGDQLIYHAEGSTDSAIAMGVKFSPNDRPKAIVHTWLAWQAEPGKPYGTAIRAKYFAHSSPASNAFVAWFRRLYGLPEPVAA